MEQAYLKKKQLITTSQLLTGKNYLWTKLSRHEIWMRDVIIVRIIDQLQSRLIYTTYDNKFGSLLCDLNECLSST